MSNVLVVAEHFDGELKKVSLPTITFGLKAKELLEGELIVLVLGEGVDGVAAEVAKLEGVDRVLVHDSDVFANYLAENYAPAVLAAVEETEAEIVVAPSSSSGKDFMPRVAAKLEAAQISDAIDIFDGDEGITYKRPIWAGNIITSLISESDVTCVTVRTSAFDTAKAGDDEAEIEEFDTEVEASEAAEFISFDKIQSDRPELTDADVVIAGGRGLKARENFEMLEELADLLGGAVGASRAAVDSNMAPNDWQIGQTGKVVAPNLYVAIAISGAIQHLAGMKNSKVIVAINKDPEAPIFQVSDYGLVADAFKVVPELTKALTDARG